MISKKRYYGLPSGFADARLRSFPRHRQPKNWKNHAVEAWDVFDGHTPSALHRRGQVACPIAAQTLDASQGYRQSVAGRRHRRDQHHALQHRPRILAQMVSRPDFGPKVSRQFRNWILQPAGPKHRWLTALDALPEHPRLCHPLCRRWRRMHTNLGQLHRVRQAADKMGGRRRCAGSMRVVTRQNLLWLSAR